MSTSEWKLSDFHSSVSLGSIEDSDHSCEPCNTIDKHVEAYGFCVDCQEFLCKTCFECHKRTKASRNHKLIDKDNFGKQVETSKGSEECTERCSVHKKEVVKFFCPIHEALGCNDCIIMEHRTCEIDYIPDKCANIGEGEEYKYIIMKLNQKIEEVNAVVKYAENREKEIDKCYANVIQDSLKFRTEINDRLDQLQKEIQQKADEKKSSDKNIIQTVLDECANISSDIKKLQFSLHASKTSLQKGQLYIKIKQARHRLRSDEIFTVGDKLAETKKQYAFERNSDFDQMMLKNDLFGKLSLSVILATPMKKKPFDNITHYEDIDVRTKSDKSRCCATGCALLSSNKLVLTDRDNNKVKIVDIQSKTITEEKPLESSPWDIAVMPQDKIAVTVPDKNEIYVMTTAGHLSVLHKIPVKGSCFGITYHQGYLYVVCQDSNIVHVLGTQGNVKNTISLNNDIFENPEYIVVSKDTRLIYISDWSNKSVVSVTFQGDVSSIYKEKDLNGPVGMVTLDDGSLLVCCSGNKTVHHISRDLKQGQKMITGLYAPQSICYSHQRDDVFIGCWDDDQLKVFKTK